MAQRFFAVFMTLFAVSVPARAEKTVMGSPNPRQEVSIQLGAFHPTARFGLSGVTGERGERFGNTGFLFTADYLRSVTKFLAAGVEGLYINRGAYRLNNLAFANQFSGAKSLVRGNTMAVLATAQLHGSGAGFRPFLLGGVGLHRTTMNVYMQAPPHFYWGAGFGEEIAVVQSAATGLIGVLRGGIEREFVEGGTLGLEFGWVAIPARRYSLTAAGRGVGMQNDVVSRGDGFSLAAKFGYRFGRGS